MKIKLRGRNNFIKITQTKSIKLNIESQQGDSWFHWSFSSTCVTLIWHFILSNICVRNYAKTIVRFSMRKKSYMQSKGGIMLEGEKSLYW